MSERKIKGDLGRIDMFYRPIERTTEAVVRAIDIANNSGFFIQADFILSPEVRSALAQIFEYTKERLLSVTQEGRDLLKNIDDFFDGDTISLNFYPKFGDKSLFPYKNKTDSLAKILLLSNRLELKM